MPPCRAVLGGAKHPSGARPSKCIIIPIGTHDGLWGGSNLDELTEVELQRDEDQMSRVKFDSNTSEGPTFLASGRRILLDWVPMGDADVDNQIRARIGKSYVLLQGQRRLTPGINK
jgi:hypothetical protein